MKYFVYSQKQFDKQTATYKKIGKSYIAGQVAVNGKKKAYTAITEDLNLTRKLFGDSVVVAQAESLKDVNYTKPRMNQLRRFL